MTATGIGVDIGGTKMLVGAVDDRQQVLHRSRRPTGKIDLDELVTAIVEEVEAAHEAAPDACGVGLGVPCTLDREQGLVVTSVNLPISEVKLGDLVAERISLPVTMDNDANCAMLAEHRFGAARGADNAVMLTLGTGIGGGIVIDGEIYRGTVGAAAEIGHLVVEANGRRCHGACAGAGCIEAYASGTSIGELGEEAAAQVPDSAIAAAIAAGQYEGAVTVGEAARQGDEAALSVFSEAGRYLGVAFASLANVFDPEMIVIGGGAAAAGGLLLDPARDELRRRALKPMNETRVVEAELGPDAGMIGAAALASSDFAGG
jgi:glucokinase